MNEVSKPLSWSMPPERVCDKLKSKDAQICELKYGVSNTLALAINVERLLQTKRLTGNRSI
jgi:hypothetical protein